MSKYHGGKDSFFDDFFREIPTFFKVVWVLGALFSVGVTLAVLYLLYLLVQSV